MRRGCGAGAAEHTKRRRRTMHRGRGGGRGKALPRGTQGPRVRALWAVVGSGKGTGDPQRFPARLTAPGQRRRLRDTPGGDAEHAFEQKTGGGSQRTRASAPGLPGGHLVAHRQRVQAGGASTKKEKRWWSTKPVRRNNCAVAISAPPPPRLVSKRDAAPCQRLPGGRGAARTAQPIATAAPTDWHPETKGLWLVCSFWFQEIPPRTARSLCPATVPLTASTSFNGICNRQ